MWKYSLFLTITPLIVRFVFLEEILKLSLDSIDWIKFLKGSHTLFRGRGGVRRDVDTIKYVGFNKSHCFAIRLDSLIESKALKVNISNIVVTNALLMSLFHFYVHL